MKLRDSMNAYTYIDRTMFLEMLGLAPDANVLSVNVDANDVTIFMHDPAVDPDDVVQISITVTKQDPIIFNRSYS